MLNFKVCTAYSGGTLAAQNRCVGFFAVTAFPICIKDDRDEGREGPSNCPELKVLEGNKDSSLPAPIVG